PAHAELRIDCRVPPGLGEDAVRAAIDEVIGADGYGIDFTDPVGGNSSPPDTPLMESIRAFVAREDPGADVAPVLLAGFSDSHWWRAAFPDCTAYGFFPMREMDACEAYGLMHGVDERAPVADVGVAAAQPAACRSPTWAGPPPSTLNSWRRRCDDGSGPAGQAATRGNGAAQRTARPRSDPLGRRGARPRGRGARRERTQAGPRRSRLGAGPGRARLREARGGDGGDPARQARAAGREAADAGREDARRDGRGRARRAPAARRRHTDCRARGGH